MTAKWFYPETQPFQVQGRDLSEDNFAQEERSGLEILIREALQNPIDARDPSSSEPVKVRINVLKPEEYDGAYLSKLFDKEYSDRLVSSQTEKLPADLKDQPVLVLEDFGTTGLEGAWDNANADGPGENWNAFWLREGEGAKASGSNGRAGQGKITYYRISRVRAVFGFTVRKSDKKKLLMGRSAFRRVYPYNGKKFLRHSFWHVGTDMPTPVVAHEEIDAFRKAFGLRRSDEPGLSLVIPFPADFNLELALQTIITDFYYPIACGHLELTIGTHSFTASNVDDLANQILTDETARKKKSSFTKGYRTLVRQAINDSSSGVKLVEIKEGWEKTPALLEEFFPEGSLAMLREAAENGKRISARFPVVVRDRKTGPRVTTFDVHIEIPEELERVEEAYIRKDLLIGSESHLSTSAHLQKARALTLITDNDLSAFLADAEEPTHLKWNGSRPRLAEDYSNPRATLSAVRNAAPRFLALISNGVIKRDVKALAKYFNKPAEDGGKRGSPGGENPGEKPPPPVIPPASVRKPFRISTDETAIRVAYKGPAQAASGNLPMNCSLEVAYEGLDHDPFQEYDPFDFDLSNEREHPIVVQGGSIESRQGNRIEFSVASQDFGLEVSGFDANIRLRARLNYKEGSHGADVSEE